MIAFATDDLPINNDGIHYDGSGMRTLGERFAQALLGQDYAATPQPAFVLTGTWLSKYTGSFFLGYEFHLDRPITVTDLGTLDYGLTGISASSQVAVFGADGSLIARTTVPALYSTPTTPWSAWRFVAVEPFDLDEGDYVIASQVYDGSEDRYIHDAQMTAADGVSWVEGRHAVGSVVEFPTNAYAGAESWWGPNLLFVPR